MGRINRDTVIAIFLLVVCGLFFNASLQIEEMGYASMEGNVWPQFILAVLTLFVLIYLVQSILKGTEKTDSTRESRSLAQWFATYRNPIWCFVLFFLFLATMPYAGMLLGGIIFVFLTLTVLGERTRRSYMIHAVISIVMITAMWAIFQFGLNVFLPEGILLYGVF